jgi:hypothetical protein
METLAVQQKMPDNSILYAINRPYATIRFARLSTTKSRRFADPEQSIPIFLPVPAFRIDI